MAATAITLTGQAQSQPQAAKCYRSFLRSNRFFLIGFLAFCILTLTVLSQIQLGDAVLWANQNRSYWLDQLFIYSTKLGEEPAYIGLLLLLLLVRYRSAIWLPFIGLIVTLIAFLLKGYFKYARPVPHFKLLGDFDLLTPIENVRIYEGWNSFPSGHAMSGFALFSFAAFCLPEKYKKQLGLVLLACAVLVGFSRVYLLHHFLRDIVFGAAVGVLIGIILYFVHFRIFPAPHAWMDKKLVISPAFANESQIARPHLDRDNPQLDRGDLDHQIN